jgi:hypothetical protein
MTQKNLKRFLISLKINNKVTKMAISKATLALFPLVGNLFEKTEGLRTSRNDRK